MRASALEYAEGLCDVAEAPFLTTFVAVLKFRSSGMPIETL